MGKVYDSIVTLKQFFDTFCKSYSEGNVPVQAPFPRMVYTVSGESNFEDGLLQVKIYSRDQSLKELTSILDKLEEKLSVPTSLKIKESGYYILRKGDPFWQFVSEEDINIKSAYVNIAFQEIRY